MDQLITSMSIHFSPLIPQAWLIGFGIIAFIFFGLSIWKKRSGSVLRTVSVLVFFLALLNPSVVEEDRKSVTDIALVIIDQSYSQAFGNRQSLAQEAERVIEERLSMREGIEYRIIEAPNLSESKSNTKLFEDLDVILSDVPASRRAGVIVISDGQIHDIDKIDALSKNLGPVHHLITGSRSDKDRQLVLLQAPSYGIVGSDITLKYKIEDTKNIRQRSAMLTLKRQNGEPSVFSVETGKELSLTIPLEHAGQNVFELSVSGVTGEITQANNRAAVLVNGVRDRLRVLLVSGQPHSGGRTWRDLLTSDPSVDLVHFTILREPNKLDTTPQNELSLIAFPFRELFEVKLYDFDLIIFDRYRLNRILPQRYFENIVRYVKEGGAFLEASGPSFAGKDSVFYTALTDVLPAIPAGDVLEQPFTPILTDIGKLHPVTSSLVWNGMSAGTTKPEWGRWLRQVAVQKENGDVLLNGIEEHPLLILDRIGDGRIAQMTSDHIWLWAKGYDGGGPHAELLRRIVHWLMKEPELDERALDVRVEGQKIVMRSRDQINTDQSVTMTTPSGAQEILTLSKQDNEVYEHSIVAEELGIYAFENRHGDVRFAVIGDVNPPELTGVIATPDLLKSIVEATGGTVQWLEEVGIPDVRMLPKERRNYGGAGWIGLRQNREYSVEGLRHNPIFPEWFWLLSLIFLVVLSWWYEGRQR